MSDLFQKMRAIEAEVARERGGILFFGLLKSANLPDQWELVIVAPWARDYTLDDLRYVAAKLQAQLAMEEILSVSRIALLGPDDAQLLAAAGAFDLQPGNVEPVYFTIKERLVTQLYIITADREGLRRAVSPAVASAIPGAGTAPDR